MDLVGELALHVGHRVEFAFRLARPWALAAEETVAGAVEAAMETADAARGRGLCAYELFALHDVVRLGASALVADRLTWLEEKIDGALAPLFARHARAADDPKELNAVSMAFEGLGLLLHAAEASAQAAAGYRRMGLIRAQQAAQTRAWTLARRCDGARTPALTGLTTPELTVRQREIAHLAASGLSNRQIADRLVLSPGPSPTPWSPSTRESASTTAKIWPPSSASWTRSSSAPRMDSPARESRRIAAYNSTLDLGCTSAASSRAARRRPSTKDHAQPDVAQAEVGHCPGGWASLRTWYASTLALFPAPPGTDDATETPA
ncbi:helix-turn-helix transcriptional regulator [Nonomuraea basaltis]|uniref:helix-turn-helix transcriptional regulator n=1 Tax=Nonomuraea basaltis TaxID=2495887 RepID=UPI0019826309|nr:hypothetical protein [Nonomuraea basaltis]